MVSVASLAKLIIFIKCHKIKYYCENDECRLKYYCHKYNNWMGRDIITMQEIIKEMKENEHCCNNTKQP